MNTTNTQLQALSSFKEQFSFVPLLNNKSDLSYENILVCGMGGSAIAANFLKLIFPDLSITLHNSYALPSTIPPSTLIIVNSYSGNTEEAIDAFYAARKKELPVAVITKGGTLLTLAQEGGIEHIVLPDSSLEPRFAIGYQMVAILTLAKEGQKIKTLLDAAEKLGIEKSIEAAATLALRFIKQYPVLYSSSILTPLTYPIKAAINEGAKLPSFINVVPEANHNELQSFVIDDEHNESASFGFIFFVSPYDHERTKKRIDVMKELYSMRNFICEEIIVDHTSPLSLLESLFFGYAFATMLAINRGVDPYATPFIAEFKKQLS